MKGGLLGGGDKTFEDSNFPYEAEPMGSPTA